MLLYDSRVSGNCYKVRLLFAQLGIPYERQEVSVIERSNRAELLGELNTALRVPTPIRPVRNRGWLLRPWRNW